MPFKSLFLLAALPVFAQSLSGAGISEASLEEQTKHLRALVARSARLPLDLTEFAVHPPQPGWALEMVSSVASDSKGVVYLLQRGEKADPVIAVDRDGRVLRSWGKGMFTIPHSIRVDPLGNIWTVDASASKVFKFTPEGKLLLTIDVGGQPANTKPGSFNGTTDIAFAPGGRIFIADGYGNARILEYGTDGKRVREWGRRGTGHGEFNLPHGIAVDERGTLYVADRENGRLQRFDLDGKYLSQINGLGKTFSMKIAGEFLYIGTQPRNEPNGAPGWLMKLDRQSGKVLGYVESTGHHSVEFTADGELMTGSRPDKVLWFRKPR